MTTTALNGKLETNLLTSANAPSEELLLSYLRHGHHEPHASSAKATNLTRNVLTISFTRTTTHTPTSLHITLHPPLTAPYNPSAHLERAVYAPTVPLVAFPHRPATYVILSWLLLLSLVTLLPPGSAPTLLNTFPLPRALRLASLFTLVIHSLEALYAATLLRRAYCAGAIVEPVVVAGWMMQTAIIGFPSLFLLMDALTAAPISTKRRYR